MDRLTVDRVRAVLDGFLHNYAELDPDRIKSEPEPEADGSALKKVVGSTLLEFVLDASKDVIIHFFAHFDRKWEGDRLELEKLAEELDGAEGVAVGKIDGMKNEKPKSFPEIGYFPCTWMFPKGRKMDPVPFNATRGFTKDRLLTFAVRQGRAELPAKFYAKVEELERAERAKWAAMDGTLEARLAGGGEGGGGGGGNEEGAGGGGGHDEL